MPSLHPHITGNFEKALQESRARVIMMASITRRNLSNSIKGLLERDTSFCNQAIADDDEIDQLEKDIDEDSMAILLRYHPVSHDLRQIMASMKIATALERVSDLATGIAKRARKLNELPELSEVKLVEPIYLMADRLYEESMTAFADENADLAQSLIEKDHELDKAHKKFIKVVTHIIEDEGKNVQAYLHLITIARCLERIGDHAANIGEEVVFMEMAKDIRHTHVKKAKKKDSI